MNTTTGQNGSGSQTLVASADGLDAELPASAADALPAPVREHVERALATLQVLSRGRRTDALFSGRGRYEAEVYVNNRASVDAAWATLAEFEARCVDNRVDAQAVYAELGHPEQLSPAARAWLAECRWLSDAERNPAPGTEGRIP